MLFVSEGCRALLGIAPDELTSGRVVYNELIDQHEREAVWQKTQVNLNAGQALGVEYRVRHADGTWRWVWDRARAIRSASGDIVALEGLILDVTARNTAEQELVRARDNLTDAVESLDHNMILWDRDDRLVLFTRHLYDQYPSADEYFKVGRTFAEILRAAVEGGTFVAPPGQTNEQFAAERIAHHKAVDGTVLARHLPNGRVLHISEHRAPSGGIVSVGRDVTELLKIEEQLREAHRMDAIGRLTGGLAHDLNNYLAVVIGNLDMLAAHKHLDPEVPILIAGAVAGALRGAELTSSLLAFSRRQSLDPRVTDVGQRVGKVAKLAEHTIGENIAVKVNTSSALWPVKIDGAQLDACIANLINNARDAMPDGGTLSISMRNATADDRHAPAGDHVLIELADTGVGMSAETLARVFEPFFTTKEPRHGTGLGLSMVYGFVHQSGGVIDVASRPGEGTTVRIFLARAAEAGPVRAARRKASTLPGGSERILLVEDNDQVRAVAAEQLTSLGYGVVETENGDTALALLEKKGDEFDLVFTDMMMPGGIDGFELAQLVLERWPGKKVLLTSGFSGGVADELEEQATGIIVLRKPYRKADLARAVRVALLT